MNALIIELRKEKRTGIILLLLAVGLLGAAYAFVNFFVRKETLLSLPLAPMDVLLTQLYGMMMVLNMFGIIVAACMIYSIEFQGNAVKKMYVLPISISGMYLCKFLICNLYICKIPKKVSVYRVLLFCILFHIYLFFFLKRNCRTDRS